MYLHFMKISLSVWRCIAPFVLLLILGGCLAYPEKSGDAGIGSLSAVNPAGDEIVSAYTVAQGTRLIRTSTPSGVTLGEIVFPGRCEALLARPGEWLIFVTTLESFRFGGNLRSRLLRWDGRQPPREFLLNDITLNRATLAVKEGLEHTLQPQLSPYGDEILFLRLHDPPAFDPYLEVVLYHLGSQDVHSVVKVPGLHAIAEYRDNGERIAWGDGRAAPKIVDPWDPQGENLANEKVAVSSNPDVQAQRVLLLRKWRAMGLITAQEYARQIRAGQE